MLRFAYWNCQKRKEASSRGLKPKYDGQCRDLGLGPGTGSVVRLKNPLGGVTQFKDLVKGHIRFDIGGVSLCSPAFQFLT